MTADKDQAGHVVTHVTPGDGNVFADLGLPDADSLKAKADLVIAIAKVIRERGLSNEASADILGIQPAALEDMLRGKFRDIDETTMQEHLHRLTDWRPHYTLAELLDQCDPSAEISDEDRAWLDDPAIGLELPDDEEDHRIDTIAAERVATFDPATAISHEELLRKYGVPSENGGKGSAVAREDD